MSHDKAVVIGKWWAGIFATLAAVSAMSAFGFAWNANSEQAVTKEKVEKMEQANLPERVARIEEITKSTDKTVGQIQQTQDKMNDKLDRLLELKATQPAR